MRNPITKFAMPGALLVIAVLLTAALLPGQAQCPAIPNIFQTTLLEQNQPGTEISTAMLQQILAAGTIPVLDVRFPQEYAISHIPGAINIPPDSTADPTNVQREVEQRSEEHTSELQSRQYLVCRLLLEKKKTKKT